MDISDEQIAALRDEAAAAGDLDQVMICDLALHGERYLVDEYSVASDVLKQWRTRGQAAAREECARVIADANRMDRVGQSVYEIKRLRDEAERAGDHEEAAIWEATLPPDAEETVEAVDGHAYTFREWLDTACRETSASEFDLRAAWRAGENPIDYLWRGK
jgi:hypothetical protein